MQKNDMQSQFINEIGKIADQEVPEEDKALLREMLDGLDEEQTLLVRLSARWSQIAVLAEEPRLFYAAAAALYESGMLEAVFGDEVDPTMVMDYAESLAETAETLVSQASEALLGLDE